MDTKTLGLLPQVEDDPIKTTERENRMSQKALKQTETRRSPSQSNHDKAPANCGNPATSTSTSVHHDKDVVMHLNDKTQQVDQKIGIIVTILETNKGVSPGRRRGGLVGSPLALPPTLPFMPAGHIVSKNKPFRQPKKYLHEHNNASYIGYDNDDEQVARPFKRIRPLEHQPSLHMVSP